MTLVHDMTGSVQFQREAAEKVRQAAEAYNSAVQVAASKGVVVELETRRRHSMGQPEWDMLIPSTRIDI